MSTPSPVLLIVEDDAQIRKSLALYFRDLSYQTLEANDGAEGLTLAVAKRPDVILLDLQMPRADGFVFCRQLRAGGLDVPILILTARTDLESKIEAFRIGADDFITKPFHLREVQARVEAALARRQRFTKGGLRGSLREFSLPEILQAMEVGNRTGVITLQRGLIQGNITLRTGKISDAECDTLRGRPALLRLLAWEDGEFTFQATDENVISAGMEASISNALMNWAQTFDEAGRDGVAVSDVESLEFSLDTPNELFLFDGLLTSLTPDHANASNVPSPPAAPAAPPPLESALAAIERVLARATPQARVLRFKLLLVATFPETWKAVVRRLAAVVDPSGAQTSELVEDALHQSGFVVVQSSPNFLLHFAGATLEPRLLQYWKNVSQDAHAACLIRDAADDQAHRLATALQQHPGWSGARLTYDVIADASAPGRSVQEMRLLDSARPERILADIADLFAAPQP
jgi:DNA-binding response OmpR family regulator